MEPLSLLWGKRRYPRKRIRRFMVDPRGQIKRPNPVTKVPESADVRLTFHNALTYNPKGHDMNIMVEQLLGFFEELWNPAFNGYEERRRAVEKAHRNSFSGKFPVQKPATSPEIEMP
ncbi:hypothetical protein AMTR_s00016p00025600 [Amborella trichopoda]|uniref:Bromo domain-containing protein n=1 Tax=Amborella trichopoda TaxID=13333 RepID=W1PEN4_AMBTC|nr:hypothetical protein AMTR_s00016p00025600 [Amborella trichopoda]